MNSLSVVLELHAGDKHEKRVPVGGAFLPNACSLPNRSRLFVRERVELLIELFWEVRDNKRLAGDKHT